MAKSLDFIDYLLASSIATATATVIPTMGLLPAPINSALDDANQLNFPRNSSPAINGLDWAIPDEPLVTDPEVHATPNPHTDLRGEKEKRKR